MEVAGVEMKRDSMWLGAWQTEAHAHVPECAHAKHQVASGAQGDGTSCSNDGAHSAFPDPPASPFFLPSLSPRAIDALQSLRRRHASDLHRRRQGEKRRRTSGGAFASGPHWSPARPQVAKAPPA